MHVCAQEGAVSDTYDCLVVFLLWIYCTKVVQQIHNNSDQLHLLKQALY